MARDPGDRVRDALHDLGDRLRAGTGSSNVSDVVNSAVAVNVGGGGETTGVSRHQRSRIVQRDGRTITEDVTSEPDRIGTAPGEQPDGRDEKEADA